jgi:DNA-binding response OmpR family regulator
MQKILVVEDDQKTADLIRLYLERNGYEAMVVHNGRVGLEMAQSQPPDLIILDLMLPGLGGLDICHSLRRGPTTKHIPIIMLTAKSTEDDKLEGLYLGADDYVTKPFSPRELMARVKAVLRRLSHAHSQPDEIGYGDLTINFPQYEVRVGGQRINLTPKEFKILAVLITHPERAFSRAELVEKAFGYDYDGLDRTIDVHVLKLRKKIEADSANPHYIQTVYGVGYKFSNQ